MNWEPSFIWQDSNDRMMSPDFLSTTQDTSWAPWRETNKQNSADFGVCRIAAGHWRRWHKSPDFTWHCSRSHGVRWHRGHSHACSINPAHSELVTITLIQTCYLGYKHENNLELVMGGALSYAFASVHLRNYKGTITLPQQQKQLWISGNLTYKSSWFMFLSIHLLILLRL